MFNQITLDKLSIGASTLCAIHCAVLPIMIALFPTLSVLPFDDHVFHEALVLMIVPMSLLAGVFGCSKHKDKLVLFGLISGLLLLILTTFLGHDLLGETGEKAFTLLATGILAAAHWRNFSLCRAQQCEH